MSLYLSLCHSIQVHQQHMPILNTRGSHYEVSIVIGQRDEIIDLVLLKLEGLNNMLYLHVQQVDQKHLVIESHDDLVESNLDLLDF